MPLPIPYLEIAFLIMIHLQDRTWVAIDRIFIGLLVLDTEFILV